MIGRLFKLTVSAGVFACDCNRRLLRRLLGRKPGEKSVVLYYHAIKDEQRSRFARQMDDLLRLAKPVRADYHNGSAPASRSAAVTFDDGFVSVVQNALPELESRNIPATLFVPTGCLGAQPAWILNGAARNHRETILSPEQLRQLGGNRLVTIGSHSVTHPNFLRLTESEMKSQLEQSKAELEKTLRHDVTLFSFPHGAHDSRSVELARKAGYQRVFTVAPRCAFNSGDEFVTGRVLVDPDDWALEFRLKLVGAYRWLVPAAKLKRRVLSIIGR